MEKKAETQMETETAAEQRVRSRKATNNTNVMGGLILIVIGVLFLLQNFLAINIWANFWPLLLIAVGLGIIFKKNE
jgi:hypothetical protein